MRILMTGDRDTGYLEKCHEHFRLGLARLFDTRMFGKGYPGYRPELRTYQEIVDHLFPDARPDIFIVDCHITPGGVHFPFEGLAELDIPKAILVGDYWNITDHYPDSFLDLLERYDIEMVMCYLLRPLEIYGGSRLADRFVHLPPCFDPEMFRDWGLPKRADVGFLGTGVTELDGNYPERNAIHRQLLRVPGLRYFWAPHPGWHGHGQDHPIVGNGFSQSINACRCFVTSAGRYGHANPKMVQIIASHSLLIAEHAHGVERLKLENGVSYVRVSKEDIVGKLAYYLGRPERLEEIAHEGHRVALRYHTCYVRAVEFFEEAQRILQRRRLRRKPVRLVRVRGEETETAEAGGPTAPPPAPPPGEPSALPRSPFWQALPTCRPSTERNPPT